MITNKEVQSFIKENDYASAAKLLLQLQLKEWEQLTKGYETLTSVKTKSFWFDGFKINLQYNPGRLISTSAKVDANTIQNRNCFLCEENLPTEQKGIKLLDNYILLCNPYPVFPEHFTIVSAEHKAQEISSSFNDFIQISKMISDKYTLIYNGPQCGASAPDHLHFQAGTKQFMPLENDFYSIQNEFGESILETDDLTIFATQDGLRSFVSLESNDENILCDAFEKLLFAYSEQALIKDEPLMNLICNYNEEHGWCLIILLRSKHRSSHYFLKGEKGIMLSPAAIDLGGVCITPLEKDFEKIDEKLLKEILSEVSLGKDSLSYLTIELKNLFR
jgi:ATP adenylyltransferase/5',5'''-P-1,P-4-tetraphosphate phosphorylase II